ncbi:HAD-IIIC family phosphatase [Aeromonas veronii]
MASLSLASTAFLMPGNVAWAPLAKLAALHFQQQGQWYSCNSGDVRVVIWFWEQLLTETRCQHWSSLESVSLEQQIDIWLDELLLPFHEDGGTPVYLGACFFTAPSACADLYPWVKNLDARFSQRLAELHLINLDLPRWLMKEGAQHCFDPRNQFLLSCPLSAPGISSLATWIAERWKRDQEPRRKVLVLDCDNTLWGGVVGEDGVSGLQLGQDGAGKLYQSFQEAVRYWYNRGVLLALCSKNSPDDVWLVFEQHGAMKLSRAQIAASVIGWGRKSDGLRHIARTLNLGLDALVFWDDSPLERAEVRAALPQVDVIEPPHEIWDWPNSLLSYGGFAQGLTKDDSLRQASYRALAEGERLREQARSESDYLRHLSLCANFHPLAPDNLPRAEQLVKKTNQFNLSCLRHDARTLELLAKNGFCGLVSLRDCFADHGLVGIVLIQPVNSTTAFLDTLALSCRVLSRGLEYWLLDRISAELREVGIERLVIGSNRCERNEPALTWLASLSLTPCDNPDPARFSHEHYHSLALEQLNLPFLEFYHHD